MKQYVCSVCGYIYDEAKGIPEAGITPGTRWDELPDTWACPLCGAAKAEFHELGGTAEAKPAAAAEPAGEARELSALEVSALCSNLAKGCEKQYKEKEALLFSELAAYYKSGAAPAQAADTEALLKLVEWDLESGFPAANAAASEAKDRGALRALVWSEKVTRILKSLLARYGAAGDVPEGTGVYVCTICGFVSVGDEPPAICPVCKVPGWKFERIEGRMPG